MAILRVEDLDAFQRGFETALAVYEWTRQFPPDERFGLTLQMRRAASSIGANIAEGFGRRRPRDKARFYNIAEGSAEELSFFVRLAAALGYGVKPEGLQELVKSVAKLTRRLTDTTLEWAKVSGSPPSEGGAGGG